MATTGHDLSQAAWRKSTHSGSGNCIQTATVPGAIAVRDSANPTAPPWPSPPAPGPHSPPP